MKAIIQKRYGPPSGLEMQEIPQPVPGDDEVRVRVRTASLHPDVWHVVTGRPFLLRLMGNGLFKPKNPIPGTDMAGVVESVGPGVTSFKPGEEVFGITIDSHEWTNGGALAEYVCVPPKQLARKPDNVTFEQAASVGTSGYIALLNLRGGSILRPGMRVLINGAAGGVGSLALQIAKAHGAQITAVDHTGKQELLRRLGADEVIDYTREDFTRGGARYDLIFDVPGNHPFSACRRALQPDGRYVLIGHEQYGASGNRFFGLVPRFLGLVFRSLFIKQLRLGTSSIPGRAEAVQMLADLLREGILTPVIDSSYPLSETGEAFRHMIEDEPLGKVVVTIA